MAGRGARAQWTALGLGTATALLTAGCAAAAPAPRDTPAASAAPAQAPGLPSTAELEAALLAPADMGSSFSRQPAASTPGGAGASGSTSVAGCPQLHFLVDVGYSTSAADRGVSYQAGDTGPVVSESLTTAPAAQLDHTYADDRSALGSCKHLEITENGETFALTLTPITFGGPQSATVRMDGTLQGVQVNAYLAIDRVGPAELSYFYFQTGDSSSQVASSYFRMAETKARQLVASPV